MPRWRARPVFAKSIGVAAFLIPVAAAVITALVTARILPVGDQRLEIALWWLAVIGSSLLALTLASRLMRKLIPLSILLRMTLAFPDRAPSRYRVALRTWSTSKLAEDVRRARLGRPLDDATEAAEVVLSLIAALGAHDGRTRGHSERTRAYTDVISEQLGLELDDRERLRWAALIHDVGKLAVPGSVLLKDDHLNESDWAQIERHPEVGWKLAEPLHEFLGEWALTILHHHEKWNGTGYPFGFSGESIAFGARIVAVADAYDAMTAARSYQPPRSPASARKELAYRADTQFDPKVVRAFLNVSVGRLRLIAGPLALLAQVPLAGLLRRVSPAAGAMATALAVVAGSAAAGAIEVPSVGEGSQPEVLTQTLTAPQVEIDPGSGDPTMDRSTVAVNAPPSMGEVEVTPDGTLLYTAPAGITGIVTIEYEACRSDGSCYQAAIELLVTGSSLPALVSAPLFVEAIAPDGTRIPSLSAQAAANNDSEENAAGAQESPQSAEGSEGSGETSPGDSAGIADEPPIVGGGDQASPGAAAPSTAGSTSPSPPSSPATISPTTTSPPVNNDPPRAVDDAVVLDEDQTMLILVLANDIDANIDDATLTVSGDPNRGTTSVVDGAIHFVPEPNFNGADHFKYRICDIVNACDEAQVDITISPVNDVPIAAPDFASPNMLDKKVTIKVRDNDSDIDGDALTITAFDTTSALGGRVDCDGDCEWMPPQNWDGTEDSFTYRVSDGLAVSAAVTVTITYSGQAGSDGGCNGNSGNNGNGIGNGCGNGGGGQ